METGCEWRVLTGRKRLPPKWTGTVVIGWVLPTSQELCERTSGPRLVSALEWDCVGTHLHVAVLKKKKDILLACFSIFFSLLKSGETPPLVCKKSDLVLPPFPFPPTASNSPSRFSPTSWRHPWLPAGKVGSAIACSGLQVKDTVMA